MDCKEEMWVVWELTMMGETINPVNELLKWLSKSKLQRDGLLTWSEGVWKLVVCIFLP